ncbi:MAG: hypothetical protein LLF96_11250, partial [Eubacteriales bacterium]|nr:hypothetical protein [Eubacteriales bacterium]
TPEAVMEEVAGMDKLAALATNTYRVFFAKEMGITGWHFTQIAGIADQVKVYRITRPSGEHAEAQIAEMILGMQKAALS